MTDSTLRQLIETIMKASYEQGLADGLKHAADRLEEDRRKNTADRRQNVRWEFGRRFWIRRKK